MQLDLASCRCPSGDSALLRAAQDQGRHPVLRRCSLPGAGSWRAGPSLPSLWTGQGRHKFYEASGKVVRGWASPWESSVPLSLILCSSVYTGFADAQSSIVAVEGHTAHGHQKKRSPSPPMALSHTPIIQHLSRSSREGITHLRQHI